MIETRLLQYFLAVAKEQNITKAAKVLHITQPTLSRQMAMLEKEIRATLFIKGSRPLSLTNEGYLLRRRAEEVLDLLAKTEAEVSCGKEELEGTVTIGCGEIAAVQYLAKIIEKFHEIHPLVVFDLYTANADQIRQRMDEGLSDIGLLLEPADIERKNGQQLFHQVFRWRKETLSQQKNLQKPRSLCQAEKKCTQRLQTGSANIMSILT